MAKPKDTESDAGREYAEIWGETIHSNRHLRVFSIVLGVLLLFVTIAVVRLSSVEAAAADCRSGGRSRPGRSSGL